MPNYTFKYEKEFRTFYKSVQSTIYLYVLQVVSKAVFLFTLLIYSSPVYLRVL
jgi:hypothetical protein